jgi:hypothetical protein
METDLWHLRDLKGRARQLGFRVDERRGPGYVLYQLNRAHSAVAVDAETAHRSLAEVELTVAELEGRVSRQRRPA